MNPSQAFKIAVEQYGEVGVDAEAALRKLAGISLSMHCWQGDDVGGFETERSALGGGLAVSGNYPGKARCADELRADAELALGLIPGRHRFNLHAIYAETGTPSVARNELDPSHFSGWIDWARFHGWGLDFNPTFFSHPFAASGMTLAHPNPSIRQFWIEHGQATRRIAAAIGEKLQSVCGHNLWIPDGMKDLPADRLGPRRRLQDSLDAILAKSVADRWLYDTVEAKLFGIGSEAYVVGSHEFYLGYAARRQIGLCLDSGHFHPTESIADKISATLISVPRLLLHVSRGIRWDSDHVVILDDDLQAILREVVRGDFFDRLQIGLDFFDASINRIAAWVIGMRATLQGLLIALLEPYPSLAAAELTGDFTSRLVGFEASKSLPWGWIWQEYCQRSGVPAERHWWPLVRDYEQQVLAARGS